jgi:hypothetical protein
VGSTDLSTTSLPRWNAQGLARNYRDRLRAVFFTPPCEAIRRLVEIAPKTKGERKMSERGSWCVHYLENGDLQKERTMAHLFSKADALIQACAIRRHHAVRFIEGPKDEISESEIAAWCVRNATS